MWCVCVGRLLSYTYTIHVDEDLPSERNKIQKYVESYISTCSFTSALQKPTNKTEVLFHADMLTTPTNHTPFPQLTRLMQPQLQD